MDFIKVFIQEFIRLSAEMSPYLLLGLFFAGILKVFIPASVTSSFLGGNNMKSVLMAALIGVPLPLCSCGVVPTGVSLNKNGASKGATVSFLISTPQTGLDSILVTYSMLGLPFALLRPFIAFITGLFGGFISNKIPEEKPVENSDSFILGQCSCKDGNCIIPEKKSRFKTFFDYAFIDFLQDIAKWLILGLILAALISSVLPDNFFTEYINNSFAGMLIMLVVSVPLYVCATSSVPVAAALMMKGLNPGAALVFLMAGPATNAATILLLGKTLGKKTLSAYLFSIIAGALIFGLLINMLPASWFILPSMLPAHHDHSSTFISFINYVSAFFIFFMIVFGKFYRKHEHSEHKGKMSNVSKTVYFKVRGMRCSHCENNIAKTISQIKDVDSVFVFSKESTVAVSGSFDEKTIVSEIEKLGYSVDGFELKSL